MATTIATILLINSGLKKKIGSFDTKGYIMTFIKTGLASGVIGVVAYLIYNGIYAILGVSKLYNVVSLLVAVDVGIIVYLVLCYVFGLDEVRDVVGEVRDGLGKK